MESRAAERYEVRLKQKECRVATGAQQEVTYIYIYTPVYICIHSQVYICVDTYIAFLGGGGEG